MKKIFIIIFIAIVVILGGLFLASNKSGMPNSNIINSPTPKPQTNKNIQVTTPSPTPSSNPNSKLSECLKEAYDLYKKVLGPEFSKNYPNAAAQTADAQKTYNDGINVCHAAYGN